MAKFGRLLIIVFCFGLMPTLFGCASSSTAKHETAGQYVDDTMITSKIKTAILKDSSLKVSQINVETYQGKVQLSGFVDSADNSKKAEEIARSVQGVNSVQNNLIVK